MFFKSIAVSLVAVCFVASNAVANECEHYEDSFDGISFKGVICDGELIGQQTITYPDGQLFETEMDFFGDIDRITGKLTLPTGAWYEGTFELSPLKFLIGTGREVYSNGIYEGSIQNYDRHGKGRITFDDGTYYEGEWKNDEKNGYGIYVLENGKYEGNFLDGDYNGKGRQTFDDGTFYDGQFENDEFVSGFFKEIDRTGHTEGRFRNGEISSGTFNLVQDGQRLKGSIRYDDYTIESCTWVSSGRSCYQDKNRNSHDDAVAVGNAVASILNQIILKQ